MSAGAVAVAFVALSIAAFIAAPLLRTAARRHPGEDMTALDRARELQSRQDMLLASLKDLDDDYATDKIGDEDYHALRDRLSGETIGLMQELDELQRARNEAEELATRPLRHPAADR